jgi:uncharacterized protein (DUF1810 family)
MTMDHDLERFVVAQEPIYGQALSELREGRKRSHWMWFIFPQLAGLGRSPTARHFAIKSRDEARRYLAHPVLGARLRACTQALLAVPDRSISDILGFPDDLKFRSSMTLFAELAGSGSIFEQALERFCGGEPDDRTLSLLREL